MVHRFIQASFVSLVCDDLMHHEWFNVFPQSSALAVLRSDMIPVQIRYPCILRIVAPNSEGIIHPNMSRLLLFCPFLDDLSCHHGGIVWMYSSSLLA